MIVSILYEYTTWTLNKWIEKKLDLNSTRMLWAILKNPESNIPQNISRMATCIPSLKQSK